MLWMVSCIDKPNTKALRDEFMDAHKKYLHEWDPAIFFSGPQQTDDGQASVGSLFILNVPDRAAAQRFIENESFYQAGVFENVVIRRVRKGHFHPDLADA
jgi:hypothetical protein